MTSVEVKGDGLAYNQSDSIGSFRSRMSCRATTEPIGAIRFGLTAIHGIGEPIARSVTNARDDAAGRPFTDFGDFATRLACSGIGAKALDALVHAGAFDCFGHPRKGLHAVAAKIFELANAVAVRQRCGEISLFDGMGVPTAMIAISDEEYDHAERLVRERDVLGVYVSGHPLAALADIVADAADITIAELLAQGDDENASVSEGAVTLAGALTSITTKRSRRGGTYAVAKLEDLTGSIDVVIFSAVWRVISGRFGAGTPVIVRGRMDDERRKLIIDDAWPLGSERVTLSLTASQCSGERVRRLRQILESHPGRAMVYVTLESPDGDVTVLRLPESLRVRAGAALDADIAVWMQ